MERKLDQQTENRVAVTVWKKKMDGAEEGSPQVINFQIMFTVAAGNTHRFLAWGGENYSQYDETFMAE